MRGDFINNIETYVVFGMTWLSTTATLHHPVTAMHMLTFLEREVAISLAQTVERRQLSDVDQDKMRPPQTLTPCARELINMSRKISSLLFRGDGRVTKERYPPTSYFLDLFVANLEKVQEGSLAESTLYLIKV